MDQLRGFWAFLRVRKRFWLLPALIILALLCMLALLIMGSAVAPFTTWTLWTS
jgi:hypothetical protein